MPDDAEVPAGAGVDRKLQAATLKVGGRIIAAVVGIPLVVLGAVAVFKTANEAGTLALIAIGAVFLLLSVTGILPRRLTIGSNTVEYGDPAAEVVSKVLKNDADPSAQESVARTVLDVAERRLGINDSDQDRAELNRLTHEARAALLGQDTVAAVRNLLPEGCIEFPARNRRDVVFGMPDSLPSQRVHVRVMYATIKGRWTENYLGSVRRGEEGCWLFIGPGSDLPLVASEYPPLMTVGWAGRFDNAKLQEALEQALGRAQRWQGDPPVLDLK